MSSSHNKSYADHPVLSLQEGTFLQPYGRAGILPTPPALISLLLAERGILLTVISTIAVKFILLYK